MNQAEVTEQLRREASTNEASRAIFEAWSQRDRGRTTVTVGAMSQSMKGLLRSREDYTDVLKFLSSLGLGRLVFSVRGRVLALTAIKATLQSIGLVALGKMESLRYRSHNKMLPHIMSSNIEPPQTHRKPSPPPSLSIVKAQAAEQNKKAIESVWERKPEVKNITIAFPVKGKLVTVEVPRGFTKEDIAELVYRFQDYSPNKERSPS